MTHKKFQPRSEPRSEPKSESRSSPHPHASKSHAGPRADSTPPVTISGKWLIKALVLSFVAAVVCGWGVLCLLFWQGSWQLLYHPEAAVARTPADAGLAFEPVGFAATETGASRLKGWWIPAAPSSTSSRYTVLYLHSQNGNLGDTVSALTALHTTGVNIFAMDYRGFGQSQFERPSEEHWRQDAAWALEYLESTRHIAAGAIVLDGSALGANLALEVAADHPELAGVIADSPLAAPMDAIFRDPRAKLVPAHLLVSDRFDLDKAAASLRISSLWFVPSGSEPEAYRNARASKTLARSAPSGDAIAGWLQSLPAR